MTTMEYLIDDESAIQLASLAVHVEEMLNETDPHARMVDEQTIRSLLQYPAIRRVLDDPAMAVFLPVKRDAPRPEVELRAILGDEAE